MSVGRGRGLVDRRRGGRQLRGRLGGHLRAGSCRRIRDSPRRPRRGLGPLAPLVRGRDRPWRRRDAARRQHRQHRNAEKATGGERPNGHPGLGHCNVWAAGRHSACRHFHGDYPHFRHFRGGDPGQLDALARKYRALVALRARRDGGGRPATRDELRALAARISRLPARAGHAGAGRAGAAGGGGGGRGGGRGARAVDGVDRRLSRADERRARRARAGATGAADGDALAAAALAPPEGRLNVMVLRELGARFGVAAATIAETLFPLRRPSPYQL